MDQTFRVVIFLIGAVSAVSIIAAATRAQAEKIRELEYSFNEVLWQKTCAQDNSPTLVDRPEMKAKHIVQA